MMARRLKRSENINSFDENLIKDLIDESKHYEVPDAQNWWDRTMKVASHLTKKYVQERRLFDPSFCEQCHIFL